MLRCGIGRLLRCRRPWGRSERQRETLERRGGVAVRESISTSAPCRKRASTAGFVIARLDRPLLIVFWRPATPLQQALKTFLATPDLSFPVIPAIWSLDTPIKSKQWSPTAATLLRAARSAQMIMCRGGVLPTPSNREWGLHYRHCARPADCEIPL
jgi:hypothetical protein